MSPAPNKSVPPPLPSNTPLLNTTVIYDDKEGPTACDRETKALIIVTGTCGGLIACLTLSYTGCVVVILRRSKRRKRRGLGRTHPQRARRIRRDVLQLHSNVVQRTSPLLQGRREIQETPISPFDISPNPSYCVTHVITPPSTAPPVHQYDDILHFTRKPEEPSETYDRLESGESCNMGQDEQQCTTIPRSTPSPTCPPRPPRSKPPPKSPPKPQKRVHPTPIPRINVTSSSTFPPLSKSQTLPLDDSHSKNEFRLSAISEGYVNEFDGPPCTYAPGSQLPHSPSLPINPPPPPRPWRRGNPSNHRSTQPQDYETPLTTSSNVKN